MKPLPSEWRSDRLKDVAIINGPSLPANTNPDYEFNYLEISNVDYYGVINPQAIERLRFEDAPSQACWRRVVHEIQAGKKSFHRGGSKEFKGRCGEDAAH